MGGGIDITKLSGDLKAFAQAADQDKDITSDGYNKLNTKYEMSLFKDLVTAAGLTDELEQQLPNAKLGPLPDVEPREVTKQTDYVKLFGDSNGTLKKLEQDINKDVIDFFKRNRGVVDPNAMRELIAARPDVTKYEGMDKAAANRQFEIDLRQWKSDVMNCRTVPQPPFTDGAHDSRPPQPIDGDAQDTAPVGQPADDAQGKNPADPHDTKPADPPSGNPQNSKPVGPPAGKPKDSIPGGPPKESSPGRPPKESSPGGPTKGEPVKGGDDPIEDPVVRDKKNPKK